jgi:hypothetical protein
VGQGRVELPTSRLSGVRSNHLSYWPGQYALASLLQVERRDSRPAVVRSSGGATSKRIWPLGRSLLAFAVSEVAVDAPKRDPRSLETEPYAALSGSLTVSASVVSSPVSRDDVGADDSLERR